MKTWAWTRNAPKCQFGLFARFVTFWLYSCVQSPFLEPPCQAWARAAAGPGPQCFFPSKFSVFQKAELVTKRVVNSLENMPQVPA